MYVHDMFTVVCTARNVVRDWLDRRVLTLYDAVVSCRAWTVKKRGVGSVVNRITTCGSAIDHRMRWANRVVRILCLVLG